MNTSTRTESGAAGITVTLNEGRIEVRHVENDELLAFLNRAPEGTWNKLWNCFHELGLTATYSERY